MLTREEIKAAQARTLKAFADAHIVLTDDEAARIEIADFGLGDLQTWGLEIITYINTERVCAKDLVLFPFQTCPEHRHPPVGSDPGKEETFRCRAGEVYVYLPGPKTDALQAVVPNGERGNYLTVWNETVLKPGEQLTIPPDTLHWFQAGSNGAIVSEFSTRSRDELDIFTDPAIVRVPTESV